MRQAGFLAAAGIYALQNNIARLKEDHAHAKQISETLAKKSFVKMVLPVETNIIIFELDSTIIAPALVQKLKEHDILSYAITPERVRLVLHLDITGEMINRTIDVIEKL
jgi:threonine aldolase